MGVHFSLLTLLVSLFCGWPGAAEDWKQYDLTTKPRVRVEGSAPGAPKGGAKGGVRRREMDLPAVESDNTLALVAADSEQDVVEWGGRATYLLRTDLADQIKPRLYTHALSISYGLLHTPTKIAIAAVVEGAYESAGERRSEVLVDSNRAELFVNDVTVAIEKSFSALWSSSLAWTLSNEFPSSPEAQRENYNSVSAVSVVWAIPVFGKRFVLKPMTEAYYIWNSYEYSPATGDLNKQGGWRTELSARFKFWRGAFVSGVVGSQWARYLDDTSDLTYRNSVGVGYQWPQFSFSVAMSNGTYLDREEATVWFVDEYRRMLVTALIFNF